jgi:hypothetical protein
VTGLTVLGQITKGPGPLWFIVWLPLGLLLTVEGRKHFFLEKEAKTSANLGARQMSGSAL